MERLAMWRAFFLAIGIMLVIVGVECLIIESANLYANDGEYLESQLVGGRPTRAFRPGEWMPFSFLAGGAVVICYAVTLSRRWGHA
jgi:hypothetical protein